MDNSADRVISRREWLGRSVGAGATLALTPSLLAALTGAGQRLPAGEIMQRAIPSTGEMLPVISLGARVAEPAALQEILKTMLAHDGTVVDTLHGGPPGEQAITGAANALGVQDKFFWISPLFLAIPVLPGHEGPTPQVKPAALRAQFESKLRAFNRPHIDVVQMLANTDIPTHMGVLSQLKKEGLVRYIGVTDLAPPAHIPNAPFYDKLESIMRNEPIDIVGVDYSIGDRRVEETILPLAQERGIGVMVYFPFDRRRIFQRASATPLPAWAADFDATTWAQFFLKYVLSHPAVIMARTGTTKAAHMLDNLGGGMGRLPDEATRKRMAALVDSLPPTPVPGPPKPPPPPATPVVVSAAIMDRYVGSYIHEEAGTIVTFRRDGDRLLVKSGSMAEGPMVARSETRFDAPWGSPIEFQLDASGAVTRAIVEQGPFRIPLDPR